MTSSRGWLSIWHDASMSIPPSLTVWTRWALHADALVVALTQTGVPARVVPGPDAASGVLLASVDAPELGEVLRRRARAGDETMVWGGTLPATKILALREAGASAYISALALPREIAEVLRQVHEGEDVGWPHGDGASVVLTDREQEVAVAYLVTHADRTRAEVARSLGISDRTLKVHIARIRDKAGHEGTATRDGLRHRLAGRGGSL